LVFKVKVQNVGSSASSFAVIKVYVSPDAVLDPGTDALLATRSVNALAAEQTHIFKGRSSESGILSGQFLIIRIDALDAVAEEDEANNLLIQQIP